MPPYAYICAGERPPQGGFVGDNALTIIDLANPLAPAFVGSLQGAGAPNFLEQPTNVAVCGGYAFVCAPGDDSLTVLNVANPAAPAFAASLAGAGAPNFMSGVYDIKIRGNYAFVVSAWDDRLVSVNISNPLAPFVADVVAHASINTPVSIYLQGNYAYIASRNGVLSIFDITDPTNMVYVGDTGGALADANFVIVDGGYAYVSEFTADTLAVVDVSTPAAPVAVGNIGGSGAPNHMDAPVGLYKVGNLVYVCAFGEWYFNVVDVTNPAAPAIAGQFDIWTAMGFVGTPRPREVIVQGSYAYVTEGDGNVTWDGLLVIDITNPAAMAIVGSIFGGGAPNFLEHAYGLDIPILLEFAPAATLGMTALLT